MSCTEAPKGLLLFEWASGYAGRLILAEASIQMGVKASSSCRGKHTNGCESQQRYELNTRVANM